MDSRRKQLPPPHPPPPGTHPPQSDPRQQGLQQGQQYMQQSAGAAISQQQPPPAALQYHQQPYYWREQTAATRNSQQQQHFAAASSGQHQQPPPLLQQQEQPEPLLQQQQQASQQPPPSVQQQQANIFQQQQPLPRPLFQQQKQQFAAVASSRQHQPGPLLQQQPSQQPRPSIQQQQQQQSRPLFQQQQPQSLFQQQPPQQPPQSIQQQQHINVLQKQPQPAKALLQQQPQPQPPLQQQPPQQTPPSVQQQQQTNAVQQQLQPASSQSANAAHQLCHLPQPQNTFIADGVIDPWSATGWKENSLMVRVFREKSLAWVNLEVEYLGKVFLNCGLKAIRLEGSKKTGSMMFETHADAAATLQRFGGGYLPGHAGEITLHLSWLEPQLASDGGTNGSSTSCKRKRAELDMEVPRVSANKRIHQLVPFPMFVRTGGRKVVEGFQFKAICVVASIKPSDPRSTKTGCTRLGTFIMYRLYKFVKFHHNEGHSWGGNLSLEDLLVSMLSCYIAKEPDKPASSVNIMLDDNKILDLLSPFYELEGELPLYFDDLRREINNAPLDMETNDRARFEHSLKVLSDAALLTPDQRSHLVQDFVNTLHPMLRNYLDTTVIANQHPKDDWRPVTNLDKLLDLIFRDAYFDNGVLKYKGMSYFDGHRRYSKSIVAQSDHIRHLLTHALGRTLIKGRQIFENLSELDYFIYHYYPHFYPRFIKFILEAVKEHPAIRCACRSILER